MLAKTVKDLPAHRYRTSGTIVRVDNASDDNNGPLTHIPRNGEPGLNARETRNGEKGTEKDT